METLWGSTVPFREHWNGNISFKFNRSDGPIFLSTNGLEEYRVGKFYIFLTPNGSIKINQEYFNLEGRVDQPEDERWERATGLFRES